MSTRKDSSEERRTSEEKVEESRETLPEPITQPQAKPKVHAAVYIAYGSLGITVRHLD